MPHLQILNPQMLYGCQHQHHPGPEEDSLACLPEKLMGNLLSSASTSVWRQATKAHSFWLVFSAQEKEKKL